jgi:hypothetical protein
MLHSLKLLLPVLIPSWRFFDAIAPSPRIEFALLDTAQDTPSEWQEFCPKPQHIPIRMMLKRIFWNPQWNASLFMVSCAERLMHHPTQHSIDEIRRRITADARTAAPYLQFRLVFVSRIDAQLHKEITFISQIFPCAERAVS